MTISIIIPTINEAKNIGKLIRYLNQHRNGFVLEIIVADGGSNDDTVAIALAAGVKAIVTPRKGRAFQMNYGASKARGDIYYFIHADTIPPCTFAIDILRAVNKGNDFGRFMTQFDGGTWALKINAFFTRFDWFVCYGGDQTLFITRKLFQAVKGYNEQLLIMEEYDLTSRSKKLGRYSIIPRASLVSTRKYDRNSWWQVQKANYTIVKMYQQGMPQDLLLKRYHEMVK